MNPQTWYTEFLRKRNLSAATGGPLYTYKISASEYKTLNDTLKISNLGSVAWDACFVLYAIEWWRRQYSGGPWTWDPICFSINQRTLSPTTRSELITTGFQKWKRQVNEDLRGNDYIGSVVIESGLPMNMLDDKHYLVSIISDIYRDLGLSGKDEKEKLANVKQLAEDRLPQSLRKEAFYQLLLQFVSTLVKFNEQFGFSGDDKPVDVLDEKFPKWRDEFPLNVESMAGRTFIDGLLKGVTKIFEIKPALVAMKFQLREAEGKWYVEKSLTIDGGFHTIAALGVDPEEFDGLSEKLELYCSDGQNEQRIGFVFKNHEQIGYHIDRINRLLPSGDRSISVYVNDPRTYKKIPLAVANNIQLHKGEPLVFGPVKGSNESIWTMCATGSCRLQKGTYYIAVAENAQILRGEWKKAGELALPFNKKVINRLDTDCQFEDQDNLYKISTIDEAQNFQYTFIPGQRKIEFYELENRSIYIGMPRIFKSRLDGIVIGQLRSGIEYKNKQGQWKQLSHDIVGKMKIRWQEQDATAFMRIIRVLPKEFSIQYDSRQHRITLLNSKSFNVEIETGPNGRIESVHSGHTITFEQHIQPVDFLIIRLTPLNETGQDISIKVPFPKDQICFYDSLGNRLSFRARIYLSDLFGARLYLTNLSAFAKTHRFTLTLIDPNLQEEIAIYHSVKLAAFGNLEIPLFSFLDGISSLLSVSENIDAKLLLFCDQCAAVEIGQFGSKIKVEADGAISLWEEEAKLPLDKIHAFRLDKPFAADQQRILQIQQNGICNWHESEGLWLIYPGPGNMKQFRPKAHNFQSMKRINANGRYMALHETAFLPKEQRMLAMEEVFTKMAADLNHPDWNRLIALFENTGHVRLSTQDGFTVLSHQPSSLMAGTLMFPPDMMERISEEFDILWYDFPIAIWIDTFTRYRNHLSTTMLPLDLQKLVLTDKLSRIANHLGLTSLKWILEQNEFGQNDDNIPPAFLKMRIEEEYNGAEQKAGLRARHPGKWPDQLTEFSHSMVKKLPTEVNELLPANLSTHQKAVVWMPFVLASASVLPDDNSLPPLTELQKFRLKELIAFDNKWFTEIYNLVQAYLWTTFKK